MVAAYEEGAIVGRGEKGVGLCTFPEIEGVADVGWWLVGSRRSKCAESRIRALHSSVQRMKYNGDH